MNLKTIVFSLCVASSVSVTRAESKFTPSENKHDIRLSISDGTPLTITEQGMICKNQEKGVPTMKGAPFSLDLKVKTI